MGKGGKRWLFPGGLILLISLLVGGMVWFLGRVELLGRDKVALITIDGVILDSKDVIDQLERYRRSPSVKAIVIRINSPGGGVVASQEIHEEILKVRRSGKPVIASMAGVAASGGYYVAAAADRIVANPGSITGSIGVIMQIPNIAGLLQKVGIKTAVIKSGEHKDLASSTRELTPAERRILQGVLDDVHQQFIQAVAQGRRMERTRVETLADGRIFSGRQALSLGLVDELGNLQDAIERAGQLGGILGEPEVIQERKRRLSLWDLLTQILGFSHLHPPTGSSSGVSLDYLLY